MTFSDLLPGTRTCLLALGLILATVTAVAAQSPDGWAPPVAEAAVDDGWVQARDDWNRVPGGRQKDPDPVPSATVDPDPSPAVVVKPRPTATATAAPPVQVDPSPTATLNPKPTATLGPPPVYAEPSPSPSATLSPKPAPTMLPPVDVDPSPSPTANAPDPNATTLPPVDKPAVIDVDPVPLPLPPQPNVVPAPQPPQSYNQVPTGWSVTGDGPPAIAPTVAKAEPATPLEYLLALLHPRQAEPSLLTLALPRYSYFQGFVYAAGGAVIAGPVRVLGAVFAGGGGRTSWLLDGAMLTTTPDYLRGPAGQVRSRFRIVEWREVQVGN